MPEIWGTLYSSFLGVAIGGFFGVAVAIFLTQDFIPPRLETPLKNIVELSWRPSPAWCTGCGAFLSSSRCCVRRPTGCTSTWAGFRSLTRCLAWAVGLLPAALVLAIMVLPTVTAISRDALASVPPKLREAAFGLGATRWETILGVIVPTASRGIYGSIILAFGRALGETMALAMLVGNANVMRHRMVAYSLRPTRSRPCSPNKFPEASLARAKWAFSLMYAALGALGHHTQGEHQRRADRAPQTSSIPPKGVKK